MEQNEIIEGNKLIAEFMGWVIEPGMEKEHDPYYNMYKVGFLPQMILLAEMPYPSAWDWFMPAFEKFRKLTGMKMPDWLIRVNNIENWIVRVNILDAYRCLVDAIKWHNESTKPTHPIA